MTCKRKDTIRSLASDCRMATPMELNVGGVIYATTLQTLISAKGSLFCALFGGETNELPSLTKDSAGRWFLDSDGVLFRYLLDYLRNKRLILPENFSEAARLMAEVGGATFN